MGVSPVSEIEGKAIPARFVADPLVRLGHVHLKVGDLDRALGFYSGVLGLQIMQRFGDSAAFLSAGGYHHHIGLNTWESLGGSPPPPGPRAYITRHSLPLPCGTGRDPSPRLGGKDSSGRRCRSRCQRGDLPSRPGWERSGTNLGPVERTMAAHRGWSAGDVHAATRSERAVERSRA